MSRVEYFSALEGMEDTKILMLVSPRESVTPPFNFVWVQEVYGYGGIVCRFSFQKK